MTECKEVRKIMKISDSLVNSSFCVLTPEDRIFLMFTYVIKYIMSETPDFTSMAEEREEEASVLDDLQIYTSMVKAILSQDAMPMDFRVNMLVEALEDQELIVNAVKVAADQKIISEDIANQAIELLKSI